MLVATDVRTARMNSGCPPEKYFREISVSALASKQSWGCGQAVSVSVQRARQLVGHEDFQNASWGLCLGPHPWAELPEQHPHPTHCQHKRVCGDPGMGTAVAKKLVLVEFLSPVHQLVQIRGSVKHRLWLRWWGGLSSCLRAMPSLARSCAAKHSWSRVVPKAYI